MWQLGDKASSEALIRDLYIDLRNHALTWSDITKQTPQARMGYVGQHLVSIVTGIPGGKSGARGFDLVLPNGAQSEIKTCYRVDQLGECAVCKSVVSSIESICAACGSTMIKRKDDSKWLIGVKTEADFRQVLTPENYYLCLFEFEDISDNSNQNIKAYIWRVDSRNLGFAACMVDYKLNIQSKSKSKASFNLWPWSLKFYLMKPMRIYESTIRKDEVETNLFAPDSSRELEYEEILPPIQSFSRATTLTSDAIESTLHRFGHTTAMTRGENLEILAKLQSSIDNDSFCTILSEEIYRAPLKGKIDLVPREILEKAPDLKKLL